MFLENCPNNSSRASVENDTDQESFRYLQSSERKPLETFEQSNFHRYRKEVLLGMNAFYIDKQFSRIYHRKILASASSINKQKKIKSTHSYVKLCVCVLLF